MSAPENPTDEQLVDRCRLALDGDFRPFEELVRRHQGKVLANCRYLTGSPTDAEDLAQEILLKAFCGLGGFEERASFETWLKRIKTNHCINFIKKKRLATVHLEPQAMDHVATMQPRALRAIDRADAKARVGEVLLGMTETLRVPLVLRDMDGLSYEEIAEHLDIGLSAVKMRIKRGREEFRRLYDESAPAVAVSEVG